MFLQIVIEVQETIGNISEIYVFFYFECRYLSYMYMHIINIVMKRALSPNFDVGRGSFSIKCRKKRIIKDFTKKLPVKDSHQWAISLGLIKVNRQTIHQKIG